MSGLLNVYEKVVKYIAVCDNIVMKQDNNQRFFAAVNAKDVSFDLFFKAQPLGENRMRMLVQDACKANSITGIGSQGHVLMHSLRGTSTTAINELERFETAKCLSMGHKCLETLRSYMNLRGKEGSMQQSIIFGGW